MELGTNGKGPGVHSNEVHVWAVEDSAFKEAGLRHVLLFFVDTAYVTFNLVVLLTIIVMVVLFFGIYVP